MSSSPKKVIIRRFLGDALHGYLPATSFVRHEAIALLDLSGHVNSLPLNDIKHICYVRDFNLSDSGNPERLTRRTFLARPRTEGLWLRLTFRSGDVLEGLAPTDLALVDDILNDRGLHLTPPDTRSNTQRIYVPRSAFTELRLLAVVTSPSRRKPIASDEPSLQEDLFKLTTPSSNRPN